MDEAKKDASKDGKKDEAKDGKDAKKDEKADLKMFKSDETFGETFALPRMDLNLGNPLENRYLRIGVSIEFTGGKTQQEELKKREPQLRDIIISSVSTRTRLDLLTERGEEKLRRELVNKINESFERPVKTIYFTDFLVYVCMLCAFALSPVFICLLLWLCCDCAVSVYISAALS